MRDYLAGPIPGGEALYTGIIRNVPGQDSLGVRIVTYLIFLLGLGTPLALLYAVGRVEDWESQTQDK